MFTCRVRYRELDRGLDQRLTPAAWAQALRNGRRPEVHHFGPGVQYAATAYTNLLADHGVAIHMAAVGTLEENGFTECLMRTIRGEEIELFGYREFADALGQFGRFGDDVYNRKGIHTSLGRLTPVEFEQQWLWGQKSTALP